MVAQCMECSGGARLENKQCLTGILNGLSQEFNVDSVILSHYIETKYAGDSMQVLREMVEIVQHLDHMGIREPHDEYFANDERLTSSFKNRQKSTCEKCDIKPEMIFSALKRELFEDISGFYHRFNDITGKVAVKRGDACEECIKATKSDLICLFNRLESFRAFVIYKGFQIVI